MTFLISDFILENTLVGNNVMTFFIHVYENVENSPDEI